MFSGTKMSCMDDGDEGGGQKIRLERLTCQILFVDKQAAPCAHSARHSAEDSEGVGEGPRRRRRGNQELHGIDHVRQSRTQISGRICSKSGGPEAGGRGGQARGSTVALECDIRSRGKLLFLRVGKVRSLEK